MVDFIRDDLRDDVPGNGRVRLPSRRWSELFQDLRSPWEDNGEIYVEEETDYDPPASAAPLSQAPLFAAPGSAEVRRRAWDEYAKRVAGKGAEDPLRRIRRRAQSPLRATLEMIVLVGALIALNLVAFPADPGFRRAEFNPFFIPVVLVAVRYGTTMGAMTGLIGALWVILVGGPVDLEDGSLVLPALLIAVGAVAGVLSRRQGRRLLFYRSWSQKLERERGTLKQTLDAKDAVIRDLQSEVEEHGVSLERIYHLCRGMGSPRPEDMFNCLLEILARDMKVDRASIYEKEGSRLVLKASFDHRVVREPFAAVMPSDEGVPGLSLRLNRIVTRFDPEAEGLKEPGRRYGLLAGPLPCAGGRRAVVWIHEMPLFEYGPTLLNRFSALLQWAGECQARSARMEEADELNLFDREVGAYKPAYLAEASSREISRAQRYGTSLRIMTVRITDYDRMPEQRRHTVRVSLSRILFSQTRETDTVCCTQQPDTFAVLLPMYDASEPSLLADRIREVFGRMWADPAPRLLFGFADLDEQKPVGPILEMPVPMGKAA